MCRAGRPAPAEPPKHSHSVKAAGAVGPRPPIPRRRGCGAAYAPVAFRKIVTAFWPPKPKPLTATVSTFALRPILGT